MRYADVMSSLSKTYGKDLPLVVVDVDGLRRRDIEPDVLKKMKATRNIWLMTGIRNAGDMMDAFHGDIGKLVVPYHMTTDADLKEMNELSDSCVPALFLGRGGVHVKKGTVPLRNVMRTLREMNFRKVLVFVTDDGITDPLSDAGEYCDIVIPYIQKKENAESAGEMGFTDVMISASELI